MDWLSSRIENPRARHSHHSSGLTERPPLCTTLHSLPALRIGMPQPSAPSFFGLTKLMQPEMSYERGYCRPECAKCAEVCPTDAIHLTSLAEKSAIQIGHAVWIKENCICITDKMECGNCARHCLAGAIQMVPSDPEDEASIKIPVVNAERCIGCGACENLCPSRPFSAIYVEGHVMHRTV